MEFSLNDVSWVGSTPKSPAPTSLHFYGFAAQGMLARFESAGASAHRTLPFSFNTGDAAGTQGIWVCSAEVC